MNRESFEKISEIREKLKSVWWNEDRNQYCDTGKHPNSNGAFLNGAWMMYQDQQKKIEEVLQQLDSLQEQYWGKWKEKADKMDQGASVAYEHSYWMLKEVL